MDYKALHVSLGFDLPDEIQLFEALHEKLLKATDKRTIYEFLSIGGATVPASTLAFKARSVMNGSGSEQEKELGTEIFNLFSDSAKNNPRKKDYDYYCSFLEVNETFLEIVEKAKTDGSEVFMHPSVCIHFAGKLTDRLTNYPTKPDSKDIFMRFCSLNKIPYNFEVPEVQPQHPNDPSAVVGTDTTVTGRIDLKALVKEMNIITADITNLCTSREQDLLNADDRRRVIQESFLFLEEKKPDIDTYLSECVSFSSNLKNAVEVRDNEPVDEAEASLRSNNIIGKVITLFEKLTRPLGSSVDKKIEAIESEPFGYLPEIKNGLTNIDDVKKSVQHLLVSYDELLEGKRSIFSESDANISDAEGQIAKLKNIVTNATQICEDANAKNKVADLIDIDVDRIVEQLRGLSEEATRYANDVGRSVDFISGISNKYSSIIDNIRKTVDQVGRKYKNMHSFSAQKVITQVGNFKRYCLIGYGAFIISLFFSIPNIINIVRSLFTWDMSWQNGSGVFAFMLIFIFVVPAVFMFARSYWIAFLGRTIRTFNQVSLNFDKKINDFEIFQNNIANNKRAFMATSRIFSFAVVVNYMVCMISFAIFVLMAIISMFVG